MNLAGVDLNLLVVFDALMAERHVTRAGERIGLSQPAMSAALSRLRHLFKDELFIRRSDGMHPTQRAIELAVPLRQALQQIQAIAPFEKIEPQFERQQLMEPADFLCVMRRGHPLALKKLTLERFAATPQLLVSRTGDPSGFVDDILAGLGYERRVAFTVPSFLLAPIVLMQTDLIAILKRRLASMFQDMANLTTCEPPFPQRKFPLAMLWHQRLSKDPGHTWLRNTLAEVAGTILESPPH